jgi:hypothetical protein
MAEALQKKQLHDPKRIQLSEHATRRFTVTVEQGTTLEDVLDPAFFAHFASQLGVYDEITVRTDDGVWFAKLLVCSCGRTWAKTVPFLSLQLTSADVDMTKAEEYDGFEVKHRGPACKWSVIRKADNKVLVETLGSKAEANTWLAQHVKATA